MSDALTKEERELVDGLQANRLSGKPAVWPRPTENALVECIERLLARLALAEAVVIAAHGVSASQAKLLPSNPPIDSERTVRIVYAPALRHLDERLAAYDAAASKETQT